MPTDDDGADVPQWDPDLDRETAIDLDDEADWYDDEEGGEVEYDCGW